MFETMENNEQKSWFDGFGRFDPSFPDGWWDGGRDPERTPLYVERFRGRRNSERFSIHDFWELTAVLRGEGELQLSGGATIALCPDELVVTPPGCAHREYAARPLDTIWLGFHYAPWGEEQGVQHLNQGALCRRVDELWQFAARRRGHIGLELDGRLLTILGQFRRGMLETPQAFDSVVEQSLAYLNEHFSEAVDMAALAAELRVSPSYFYRCFRRRTGMTPVQYLTDLRIKNVMTHLRQTRLPLNRIAPLCGFSDPYYLSKTFKKVTGVSPARFRAAPQ